MRTTIRRTAAIASAAAAVALIAACAGPQVGPGATARLQPTAGNTTMGTVSFNAIPDATRVAGEISGLTPNAMHGFHVHEKGDCSAPDASSAGEHFNPSGKPHGAHNADASHVGDFPNLKADAKGVATFNFESKFIRVGQGPADVIGRSLVVHRNADDLASQPSGNSGPRIACAVISRN